MRRRRSAHPARPLYQTDDCNSVSLSTETKRLTATVSSCTFPTGPRCHQALQSSRTLLCLAHCELEAPCSISTALAIALMQVPSATCVGAFSSVLNCDPPGSCTGLPHRHAFCGWQASTGQTASGSLSCCTSPMQHCVIFTLRSEDGFQPLQQSLRTAQPECSAANDVRHGHYRIASSSGGALQPFCCLRRWAVTRAQRFRCRVASPCFTSSDPSLVCVVGCIIEWFVGLPTVAATTFDHC